MMHNFFNGCRRVGFVGLLISLAIPASRAAAQNGAEPVPLADPAEFFEQLFGRPTAEDRQAIEQVEISWAEEKRFGDQAARAYLQDLRQRGTVILRRGPDVEYLQQLVATVRPFMRRHERYREVQVLVADSETPDARSFPGGTLVFHRGLVELTETEAALVGVVGHELSHLDHGHQLYHLRQFKLAQQTFTRGAVSPEQFLRQGTRMMQMFMRPFRPEDEAEADEDGARWAWQAGYDPREMAALFARIRARDAGPGLPLPAFFRTHPLNADRQLAVLRLFAELQAKEPKTQLYIGRENLRRRIPMSVRRFE